VCGTCVKVLGVWGFYIGTTFLEAGKVGGSTTLFFKKLDFESVSLSSGKETTCNCTHQGYMRIFEDELLIFSTVG